MLLVWLGDRMQAEYWQLAASKYALGLQLPSNELIASMAAISAGVLLWRIFFAPPNTPATFPREGACVTSLTNPDQPGSAWATKLSFPGFGEVTTMAWSPDGLFLAVGSGTSPTILIWDVALEAATPIAMGRGGTLELKWSPDGNYLLQSNEYV